jgi:hypothetical protein
LAQILHITTRTFSLSKEVVLPARDGGKRKLAAVLFSGGAVFWGDRVGRVAKRVAIQGWTGGLSMEAATRFLFTSRDKY